MLKYRSRIKSCSGIPQLRVFAPRKFELRLHGAVDEVVAWLPSAHQRQTQVELPAAALREWLRQAQDVEPVSRPSLY